MIIEDILASAPVVPVLTLDSADHAVPLARALVAGGLPVLEITLRIPAALPAIAAIAAEVPDAVVGAGTVLAPDELEAARRAGARFFVSPGLTAELARAAAGLAYLPGAVTPSEIMAARALGFRTLKFFPAETSGGPAALAALAGPFAGIRFCPTGGVREATLRAYLHLPNVVAVGGTWLFTRADAAAPDWPALTRRARRARDLAMGQVEV